MWVVAVEMRHDKRNHLSADMIHFMGQKCYPWSRPSVWEDNNKEIIKKEIAKEAYIEIENVRKCTISQWTSDQRPGSGKRLYSHTYYFQMYYTQFTLYDN